VTAAYDTYLAAMARGVENYRKGRNVFPVLIAMEMLDRDACERIAQKLGGAPIFSSDRYDMYELVSILRACHRLLSSRYHAIVTSMPAGIPSAGVAMDERVRNLMRDRGHDHLLMEVDEPHLANRIVESLRSLDSQEDEVREGMARAVIRNLPLMARMGVYLEEEVARHFPGFPVRKGVLHWEDYLPPLSSNLRRLLETHESAAAAARG
jgi:polysaccharide pyruvyl transferase WcaK-like protein